MGLAIAILLLLQCQEDPRLEILQGKWVSYRYEVADSAVNEAFLDDIQLHFQEDVYHFQAPLDYWEAGQYRLIGQLLMVTDTTRPETRERRMRIEQLNTDTLLLKMQEDSLPKRLWLKKQ